MFLGFYNYTVYLTYLNLLSGFLGIYFSFHNNFIYSSVCLLISGIFDIFDGIVSRFKKNRSLQEKIYGIQIDSLADLVSFGVLPVLIGWNVLNRSKISEIHFFLSFQKLKIIFWFFGSLYVLAALIRLAHFNVMAEKKPNCNTKIFIGIPVTFSAICFPLLILSKSLLTKISLVSQNIINDLISKYIIILPLIYLFFIILLSFLFIFDKIKFQKPKSIIYFIILAFFSIFLIFSLLFF